MRSLPKCRYCGCDDLHACPGGCSWHKPEYCSACAEKHWDELVNAAANRFLRSDVQPKIGVFSCAIFETEDHVVVVDHIGVIAFSFGGGGDAYLAPHYDAPELMPLFEAEERRMANAG